MPSVSLCRALCLIVCLAVAVPAQTRRRAAPAKPPTPPAPAEAISLPDDLAMAFPDTTAVYVELADIASLLETNGLDAQIYEQLNAALKLQGVAKLPFTLAESRTLLGVRLAIGEVRSTSSLRTNTVAVIRAPSAQTMALVRDRLIPLFYPSEYAKTKPLVQTEHGQKVTIVAPGTYSPLAFAVMGNDVLFGVPVAVSAIVGLAAKDKSDSGKSVPPLASVPAFVEARAKLSSRNNAFVYVDARPIMSDMYGSESSAEIEGTVEARAVHKDVLGVSALSAFAFSLGTGGGSGSLEFLAVIDRSKESLLSIFTDPPSVQLNVASALPADTHVVATFGFEPARLVEFIDRKVIPSARKVSPRESEFEGMLRYAEARVEMKLREEFLASLGDEIAIGIDAAPMLDALAKGTPPPSPVVYAAIEVTNPDVARPGLARLFGPPRYIPEDSEGPDEVVELIETDDQGVTVARVEQSACAVVDGLAFVGTPESVARALQAYRSGNTLATAQLFAGAKAQAAGDTVALVFGSPRLADGILAAIKKEMLGGQETSPLPVAMPAFEPVVVAAEKYSAGVHARMTVSTDIAVAGIGLAAAVAIPSLLVARRASHESAAVGNLRTIGSAEATFLSQHGRCGTFSELVAAQMLDSEWVNGVVRDGYRFTQVVVTKNKFEFAAEPADASTGQKAYNITDDYVIRYTKKGPAPRGKSGRPIGT